MNHLLVHSIQDEAQKLLSILLMTLQQNGSAYTLADYTLELWPNKRKKSKIIIFHIVLEYEPKTEKTVQIVS